MATLRGLVAILGYRSFKRRPGTGKGGWMAPDFDEPLEDFAEYM